ncbi:MAG: hypothetical protein ABIK61_04075 [candidate division WOR-3 bacterium]
MGRIIVTTCGTSLLESSCWQLSDDEQKTYQFSLISELKNRKADKNEIYAKKAQWTSWINGFMNTTNGTDLLAQKFNEYFWNNNNLIDLPAELASLRAIQLYFDKVLKNSLTGEDKIVLLHSTAFNQNNEGPFCAEVIKNITYNLLPTQLEKKEIPNLNPLDRINFENGLRGMENYVRDLISESTNRLFLNLTAGYKAFAIQLAGLAAKYLGVTIFYLYEETDCDQLTTIKFKEEQGQFRSEVHITSMSSLV